MKRIGCWAVASLAAFLPAWSFATIQTVISEDFEDDTVGSAPPTNVGLPGTWIPNQYASTPYFDPNNPNPDTNWQVEVFSGSVGVGGSKAGVITNIWRGFWEPGATSGPLQEFERDGFLKADVKADTPGQIVRGHFSLRNNDGIQTFGLSSNVQAMADATAGNDPSAPPGVGIIRTNANPNAVLLFSYGDGFEGGEHLDAWVGGSRVRLDPDPTPFTHYLFEFQYTVGSSTLDYLKLNGATVTIQAGEANAGGPVPLNVPGGAIDGMFFSDSKNGTDYAVDNIYMEIETAGSGSSTWNVNGSGDWNVAGNWSGGAPNGPDAVANLGSIITSPQTVYSNTAITAGTLKFDNANGYQIAGQGSLTIQVSSGAGSVAVAQGGHKINLPLFFASDASVGVAGGATLTIANPVTIKANKTVTKTGTVLIEAPLTLEAGATLVTAGGKTTLFGAPSLGTGAKIDLKNTSMSVDYRGQASPATTIKGQIAASSIMSSSAIANQTGIGWMDDSAAQSILVKYTYLGDTNLDGQVDVIDLGNLATAWQTNGVWVNGDSNYDNFVDVIDLGMLATNWQAGVGSPLGPGSLDQALAAYGLPSVSVPEPAAACLIGLCLAGLAARRYRRT